MSNFWRFSRNFTFFPLPGQANITLAIFDNPVSPYQVTSAYRRPAPHTESDLGYSTMTPQEDSEQASTTCVEPLIIGRDRYRPSPHIMTQLKLNPMLPPPPSSRGSRSPSPPQTKLLTPTDPRLPPVPDSPGQEIDTPLPPPQTVLPDDLFKPNQVVASVQVHTADAR